MTSQALADYFQDKMAKVHANTLSCPPLTFMRYCVAQFDESLLCTIDHIRNAILQLPVKSCQLDPIPHAQLKMSLKHLLPLLHFTCNASLHEGRLPNCEKSANITPILKKPGLNANFVSSYHSFSNPTYFFKLIERLISHQLTSYLRRQHDSTETVTLKVVSDIFDFADSGQVALLSLLNLSTAFDTMDHKKLAAITQLLSGNM